jgi:hypothetical protein
LVSGEADGESMPPIYEFEDEYTKYYCKSKNTVTNLLNECSGITYEIYCKAETACADPSAIECKSKES